MNLTSISLFIWRYPGCRHFYINPKLLMDVQGLDSNLLLALPLCIRQRIYAYLGFARLRVDLNVTTDDDTSDLYLPWSSEFRHAHAEPIGAWSSRQQKFNQWPRPTLYCRLRYHQCYWCYPLSNQLFYVSRAVSRDARSMFYSKNRFRIADRDTNGLLALRNLGPTALESLRWISIRLDTKECRGSPCHDATAKTMYWASQKDATDSRKLQMISEWTECCARLSSYIKPYQLELEVICGAYDMLTAERFLLPLLSWPILKNCSIRLGPFNDTPLQMLTERIVMQTTQYEQDTENTVFPFLDLPVEIQLHVLKYTGLVSPHPLTWESNHQFAPDCCRDRYCDGRPLYEEASYCSSTHTAYSSVHQCWRNPVSLFHVNRQLRQRAQYIFYSQNKFDITLDPWSLLPWPELSIFTNLDSLKPFPRDCLQHLRYIEWTFTDELEAHYVSPEQRGHPDWINLLNLLAQNAALQKLTLVLNFGPEALRRFFGRWQHIEPQNLESYDQIVQPMTRLKGLKDFFINLSWHRGAMEDGYCENYEQILERLVMGDAYDSFARGKVSKRIYFP